MTTSQHAQPTGPVAARVDLPSAQAARRERLIGEITDRLAVRFPNATRHELEDRVRQAYTQFSTSRVQDYLAILVERLVRRSLQEPGPRTEPARPR
jgi:hypothetical protein